MSALKASQFRMRCPHCREQFDAETRRCYCQELQRRQSYDRERQRRGLVALYRPAHMR